MSSCSAGDGPGFSSGGIPSIIVTCTMHEAAILDALVEQVETFTPEDGRLVEVKIEVGGLEHLDHEVMRSLWEIVTGETRFAGSDLVVIGVPVRVRCRACGSEHEPEDPAVLFCPDCGAVRPEVLTGTGVLLRSLEVER